MPSTTYPEFNASTEALEVTKAFGNEVRGKTIMITGGNRAGIAFSTAQALASQAPARIIVVSRTESKTQEFIDTLKGEYPDVEYRALQMDLSSLESVRAGGAAVLAWTDVPAIDILINTAGVMCLPERTLTKEGIEMHFATNHIGHWLFTCIITPKLIKAAENSPKGATRVVNVSSASATISAIRWSDLTFEKKNKDLPEAERPNYPMMEAWGAKDAAECSYIPVDGYHRSKVANVLFGIGANKRLLEKHGILSVAAHPGVIATELGRNLSEEAFKVLTEMMAKGIFTYKSLGAGAATSAVAALDPKLAEDVGETKGGSENFGAYMMDCQISDKGAPLAVSSEEAERLWELTEKLTRQKFSW